MMNPPEPLDQPEPTPVYKNVLKIEKKLKHDLENFICPDGISVLKPLNNDLIWKLHKTFLKKYMKCVNPVPVLFVGMNPSPKVMAIAGIAFGDPWRIPGVMENCFDEENTLDDSGTRFWGYIKKKCKTGDQFFKNCFIYNYCPHVFTKDDHNYPLNKFEGDDQQNLQIRCDPALLEIINATRPQIIVGIGVYAYEAATRVQQRPEIQVVKAIHPSPLTGMNADAWCAMFSQEMDDAGVSPFLQPDIEEDLNDLNLGNGDDGGNVDDGDPVPH